MLIIKLLLRTAIIIVITWGLLTGLYSAFGTFQAWQLLYYTNLSNLAVMLLFLYLLYKDFFQKTPNEPKKFILHSNQLKMALTWAISITGIVWHTLLAPVFEQLLLQGSDILDALPASFRLQQFMLSVSLLHTWSPLLVFLDWLLFNSKEKLPLYAPLTWLSIPLLYLMFICAWVQGIGPVNAQLHITYPYPFIDFAAYPATQIWHNITIISMGSLTLGYIYWGINRLILYLKKTKP